MNYLKPAILKGLVVGLVVANAATVGAQTFYETPGAIQDSFQGDFQGSFQGGFQGGFQGNIVSTEQVMQAPSEEQLKELRIGVNLYDSGSSPAVRSVFTNGPAQKAGLQSGDLVTKINGEAVTSVSDFNGKLSAMAAGDSFQLTHSRDGKEADITVSVMMLSDILQASLVPEAGVYDSAISQAEIRLGSTKQQLKNAELDLEDLKKSLAEQEKDLGELKAKAETAAQDAEKKKSMEAAKKNDAGPEMKREGGSSMLEKAGNAVKKGGSSLLEKAGGAVKKGGSSLLEKAGGALKKATGTK